MEEGKIVIMVDSQGEATYVRRVERVRPDSIKVEPDPELINKARDSGLGAPLPAIFQKLRHPLHHLKYMIAAGVFQFCFFPVEHYLWTDVLGISF